MKKQMMTMRLMLLIAVGIFAIALLTGCADNQPLKYTTIHEAAEKGDLADVKRHLARRGAALESKNEQGCMPLHVAAYAGHTEVVNFLLKKGADVQAKDEEGWTPLHHAAAGGHPQTVQLLVKSGADVNAKDRWGDTPLYCAGSEVVKLLRKHGAKE